MLLNIDRILVDDDMCTRKGHANRIDHLVGNAVCCFERQVFVKFEVQLHKLRGTRLTGTQVMHTMSMVPDDLQYPLPFFLWQLPVHQQLKGIVGNLPRAVEDVGGDTDGKQ